ALDFVTSLTNLAKEVSLVAVTASAPASPVLSGDAGFSVSIDSATPVPVTLLQTATAGNANIDDLVNDLNAALVTALGAGVLEARRTGDRLRLVALNNAVNTVKLSALTGTAASGLHFAEGQQSSLIPDFANLQEFAQKLADKLGLPGPESLGLNYDPATNRLTFALTLTPNFSRPIPLGLQE